MTQQKNIPVCYIIPQNNYSIKCIGRQAIQTSNFSSRTSFRGVRSLIENLDLSDAAGSNDPGDVIALIEMLVETVGFLT